MTIDTTDIEKRFEYIKKSRIVVIGYSFKHEVEKDLFIDLIPHKKCDFRDLKLFYRESKIESVLEDKKNTNFLLINFNDIKQYASNMKFPNVSSVFDWKKILESVLRDADELGIKLIITTPTHRGLYNNNPELLVETVNNSLLYACDLAFIISNKVEIIKNRFDLY